ncbi:hypothetical protein SDC9_86693 [bioreactor metagenome]|uniref:Uncharacterized protein n=1 Tax=bioreactor metagenome TaxID=1076179 RepID=A0A644ZGN6_9ZZZZ
MRFALPTERHQIAADGQEHHHAHAPQERPVDPARFKPRRPRCVCQRKMVRDDDPQRRENPYLVELVEVKRVRHVGG